MKWFKHDSNASIDAKLKRLRLKYGMEGYGLYWYLLECIARTVEPHNLTFELEEDAELIAAEVNIHRDRVEEMMLFMCEQGLFENADGRITCLKMASRSDEYTLKLIRKGNGVQTSSGQAPDKVPPIRIEQKDKKEKKQREHRPFEFFYEAYGYKKSRSMAEKAWKKLSLEEQDLALACVRSSQWKAWREKQKKDGFMPFPASWLNAKRWGDELPQITSDDGDLYV